MRYKKMYPAMLLYASSLILVGFILDDPRNILPGLRNIVLMPDALITDYMKTGGPGAAFVNAGLVTLISILVIYLSKDALNGFAMVEMGLMSGFALFGKNFVNILPIIAGTWLYAKYRREPFAKYSSVALLSTALSPMVTHMAGEGLLASAAAGILIGLLIGFVLPALSS
ncbi:MAG: DUF1576 domain-containing protein, partial [Clostridiales bacterium]|nr:DUF1576 domain-containing protein [Clostridiales bacterium]